MSLVVALRVIVIIAGCLIVALCDHDALRLSEIPSVTLLSLCVGFVVAL